jgi:hypothetical protein
MNLSAMFRTLPKTSVIFITLQSAPAGVGRGKKYAGAEVPEQDIGHDFLIMEEAYTLFDGQGERRSLRMIGEYCKTGELICSYDTDDKRWHITRESVEQKIAKIKALNARKLSAAPQNPQSTSEAFSESPAAAPQRATEEVPPQSESDPSPFAVIKKLRKRILNLRILNQGKDYLITKLQEERGELLTRIETSNRLVGELKLQLLQLEAPKDKATAPQTPSEQAVTYRDVEEVSSSDTTDPTPSVSPTEPLTDNANPTYEFAPQ